MLHIFKKIGKFIKADFHQLRYFSFAETMSEALDKLEKSQNEKGSKNFHKPRYNGRVKKRQWECNENNLKISESDEKQRKIETVDRVKRKKCIILLGYSGINYFGMQRNPGMKTIEEDLFKAMLKNQWIGDEGFNQAQTTNFQRAARTDKGVSATRQCCSLKLPDGLDLEALNKDLPEQIRVFSVKRVTKGFNSKDQCNARTYTYTLPTIAFDGSAISDSFEEYRLNNDKIDHMNKILKMYEGTKNFHNFTSRKDFMDPSSKRYIISFDCGTPLLSPKQVEYVVLKVKGQSFMLHQIRKMIGLALAIIRGHTTEATLTRSFSEEKLDIPMAPGLGLVLDQVHYERYNDRYGSDGLHEPLTWENEEQKIKEFFNKYIQSTIFEVEENEKNMLTWLETLNMHSYDVRKTENDQDMNNEKNVTTNNINDPI